MKTWMCVIAVIIVGIVGCGHDDENIHLFEISSRAHVIEAQEQGYSRVRIKGYLARLDMRTPDLVKLSIGEMGVWQVKAHLHIDVNMFDDFKSIENPHDITIEGTILEINRWNTIICLNEIVIVR